MTYVLTPAMCWCQYFYKTFPEQRTATFLSIKNNESRIFLSTSNFCDLKECGKISEFDLNGNKIWENLLKNNDVGISTLQVLNDTIYIGGNYNIGFGKTIINRIDLSGNNIDEFVYSDPLNRISGSLMNQLFVLDDIIYFSGASYVDGLTSATIYSIDRAMNYKSVIVDTTGYSSSTFDACIGPDSLLTCFIMQSNVFVPKDRRRIEKYDKDLNLVWKYQPPDSLLWLGNRIYLHGTVLDNGNIFFTYYTFGNERSLPSLLLLDTITKKTIWQYDFPNIDNYGRYVLKTKQLKNGDLLISGYYSNITQQPTIKDSPWLMRIDKNGKKIWEHTYVEILPNNQSKAGALWDAIELDNGDIIACGFVSNNNKWDPLLIRTDADGCIDQGQANCPQVQIIDLMSGAVDVIGEDVVTISPNPGHDALIIELPYQAQLPLDIEIIDIHGRKIHTAHHDEFEAVTIDALSWASGIYVVHLRDRDGRRWAGKWVRL